MKQIVEAIYEKGFLKLLGTLHIPEGRHVTVCLETSDEPSSVTKKRYDFTDLVGKLSWEGDAVDAQRRIRDEW